MTRWEGRDLTTTTTYDYDNTRHDAVLFFPFVFFLFYCFFFFFALMKILLMTG